MCITQFALANQACAVLPTLEAHELRNDTSIQPNSDEDDGDDDEDDDEDDDDGSDERETRRPPHGRGNRQRGGHGNGNRGGHGNQGRGGNRVGHGNRGGHRNRGRGGNRGSHEHEGGHKQEPRVNLDCCRWMEEVDEECVCATFLRLPPFLFKPKHTYDIKIGSTCSRSFECKAS